MDLLLKQRLVGAVVLVALAVIFIPMLLEGPDSNLVPEMAPLPEPRDQGLSEPLERFAPDAEIPAQPEQSVVHEAMPATAGQVGPQDTDTGGSVPLSLPPEPATEPQTTANPGPESAEESTSPPLATVAPAAMPQASAESSTPAPGPLGSWVVQVGSFSSEQNALRLRDRLRKEQFATQVERVVVDAKPHFRVRVGPYLERAEAEQQQKKLASAFDLKGRVLSYP